MKILPPLLLPLVIAGRCASAFLGASQGKDQRGTLCDVRVETGERFALTVEPIADEEIYKLVAEVCRGVHEKLGGDSSPTSPEFKPAEEVERALRNMAGLPRPARARKGAVAGPDPAADLAQQYPKLDDFIAEFAARLSLWRRSRRAIEFDGVDPKAGRRWLIDLHSDQQRSA